jgi:uncharacterized protein (TIGR02246 family)
MNGDETAIRKLVATWMAATKAGDLDNILGLMADDVIFMTPGREPFGKKEFAAQSRGMKDMRIEGTARIEEIEIIGDRAWLRNRIEIEVTPPGGEKAHRAGWTLTVLRREGDGRWRLWRDANLVS